MADLWEVADELESIGRHLRRAGEIDLERELVAAFRRAVRPVPGQIRRELKPHLPDRYAADLDADVSIGVSVRTADKNPGVSIYAKARGKGRKLRRLDAGLLTHPLYGDREHWFTQSVVPEWFTGPAKDAAPRVRDELQRALDDIGLKIASKGL